MSLRHFLQIVFGILTFYTGIYNLRAKKLGSGGSYSARYCYKRLDEAHKILKKRKSSINK